MRMIFDYKTKKFVILQDDEIGEEIVEIKD